MGVALGARGPPGAKSGQKWKAWGQNGKPGANALIPGSSGPVLDLPT